MVGKLSSLTSQCRAFVHDEMWVLDHKALSKFKRAALNGLKVAYIVVRGFIQDECFLQASALTFITLMSIVPVLALVLSAARGLNFDAPLRYMILEYTQQELPIQIQQFIGKLFEMVESTNFVALGSLGCIFIVATLLKVMDRVETTLNGVWGVREGRTWGRKFADYLSILFVVPFLFLLATSINTAMASESLTDQLQVSLAKLLQGKDSWLQTNYHIWYTYYLVYGMVMRCIGFVGIIGAMTFLYQFIPNTKVKIRSALIGGLCAGIMWILWQKFCISFQFWVTKYNAIYGAFASLPVGLFWLNINWVIILFGAEISFAYQNYETYVLEQDVHLVTYSLRRRLAFRLVLEVCRCFKKGEGAWRPQHFQLDSHIPVRLLHEMMHTLKSNGIITDVADGGWVPAKALDDLTLKDVEMAVAGGQEGKFSHLGELPEKLVPIFEEQHRTYLNQLGSKTYAELTDLVEEVDEPMPIANLLADDDDEEMKEDDADEA